MSERFSIPWFAGSLIALVGFIKLTNETIIGKFLAWFPFGWGWFVPFLTFVVGYYEILIGTLVAGMFIEKTKNVYILGFIVLMVWLFLKFGLRSVGVV